MEHNEPLNDEALEDAADLIWMRANGENGVCRADRERKSYINAAHVAREAVVAYLAAAPPLTAEDLVVTRAGLALANDAYTAGLNAGITACLDSVEGEPFVKPMSPYSAPLAALIKAEQ